MAIGSGRQIMINIGAQANAGQINQQVNLVVNQINRISQASQKSGSLFASITGGNLAARGISEAVGFLKQMTGEIVHLGIESVKLAANFQETTNALAVFTGSQRLAKAELAELDALAAKTPGLRLQTAEEGYQRLRALGFQAEETKKLVAGLGNQKILSGADNAAVDRVIVNLTQIRASSKDANRDIKEMIKAIPSLSGVFQDAFGTADTGKLKSFLQQDPKAFFDKLATGLANAERAEGGLNDATGKLTDSFLQAGRAFGEPLLEPLTNDVKGLTDYINDNKDTWREWGQYVSDIIRGVAKIRKEFAGESNKPKADQSFATNYANYLGEGLGDIGSFLLKYSTSGIGLGVDYLNKKGEAARQQAAIAAKKNAPGLGLSDINRKDFDSFFDAGTNTLRYETGKEKAAREKVEQGEAQRNLENAKQKELQTLKDSADESAAILKNRYEREQAIRELNNRFTASQEISFLKESETAKANYLNSEIARVSGFYDKQIALQSGNDEEIQKLTSDRNKKLDDLEAEKATSAARSAKQIQDLENRIYEERRQAAIEFGNLQIREAESAFENKSSLLERSIERETVSTKEGFDTLKKLTQSNYEQTLALTKSQYEKQLENLSLTEEQAANIRKESELAQKNLEEKKNRDLLEIQDRYQAARIQKIQQFYAAVAESIQSEASLFQEISGSVFNFGNLSSGGLNAFANQVSGNASAVAAKQKEISALTLKLRDAQDASSDFIKSVDGVFTFEQTGKRNELQQAIDDVQKSLDSTRADLDALKGSTQTVYPQLIQVKEALYSGIESGNKNIFDEVKKQLLEIEKTNTLGRLLTQLDSAKQTLAAKNTQENRTAVVQAETAYADGKALYANKEYNLSLTTSIALRQQLNALITGDKIAVADTIDAAEKSFLIEAQNLAKENISLQQKYYEDSDFLAQQDLNRRLNNEREVFELRQELSQKTNFDQNESDAKVLAYLNSQIKSASEAFADFRIGLAGTYLDAITSPFDALEKKLEKMNPIVRGLAKTFLDLGRDIVKAFSQKIIMQLLGLGDGAGSGSSGGNWFQKILSGALGGGGGNTGGTYGGGNQGSGVFSFGNRGDRYGAGGFGVASVGGLSGVSGSGSTGLSSIFGEKGFGNNVGTYGAIGAGAGILGGLIGGRVGGLISGAGAGLGIGAQIGSMIAPGIGTAIGAAVGAVGGGLISLLGGDPKRKRDKKEKVPNLQKGFIESFAELNQILKDSDNLKFNPPEEANTRADAVYSEISSGFNLVFESKKYRNEAQKQIEQKKKEADVLRGQIRASVLNAQNYASDSAALVPVFATGNHFGDDYEMAKRAQRPHGFIAGGQLGKDRHLGLFADGETIINHVDRMKIINGAGYDVFNAHANIPNYPKYADGNYFAPKGFSAAASPTSAAAPNVVLQPTFNLILQGELAEMINLKIKDVLVEGLKYDTGIATKVAEANAIGEAYGYGKGRRR